MDKIKKFFLNMKTHFRRNNPQQEATESKETEDAVFAKDEDPSKQTMNSGEHKPIYGINRKIIAGLAIAFVLIFSMSYAFFKTSDNGKPSAKAQLPHSAQTPSEKTEGKKQEEGSEYKKLYDQRNAQNQQTRGANSATTSSDAKNAQTQIKAASENAKEGQQNTAQGTQGQTPAMPHIVQTAESTTTQAPAAAPASVAQAPAASKISEAQQKAAELEKRFASAIDFALGGQNTKDAAATASAAPPSTTAVPTLLPTSASASPASTNMLQLAALSPASSSPYVIQAGTLIPAMLFSGINTDTPGQVVAQTTADVYDSFTQTNLLIPVGSRLIGTYAAGEELGNGRVNVTFSTIIFPSGETFDIGASILAVDGAGYNGLTGKVHRHTMRSLGAGMFSSAIAALGSLASGNTNSSDTYSGGQIAMQGAMANLVQATSRLFDRGSDHPPTVKIEPGHTFQLFVVQPIAFGEGI